MARHSSALFSTAAAAVMLCTAGGLSAVATGRNLEFEQATTDEDAVFDNPTIDAVISVTRHDLHARHVVRALDAGKAVFVEKPLCLTLEELSEIEQARKRSGEIPPLVMVGFNRRFAAAARLTRDFFDSVSAPLTVSVRFNAGQIPVDHWVQDEIEGGGRIIGEACHAIDLATFLVGSPPVRVFAESVGSRHAAEITDDQCFITLRHANGSVSSVGYLAGGDKSFPKERIEVIGGGRIAVIDDFRTVSTCKNGRTHRRKLVAATPPKPPETTRKERQTPDRRDASAAMTLFRYDRPPATTLTITMPARFANINCAAGTLCTAENDLWEM